MPHVAFATPLGDLSVFEDKGAIVAVEWGHAGGAAKKPSRLLARARRQLDEYFAGRRRQFDLPLRLEGSAFQQRVWAAIARIPYGQTASYGDLAHQLDSGPRAVGGACGHNPLGVIVPCHRVLGARGAIGGWSGAGGLVTKRQLLKLEGVV